MQRFFREGCLYDIGHLEWCLQQNLGNLTFQEAFNRTGRVVNISISPSISNHNHASLLNHLTAPTVLLWSAVSASCALPLIFKPVQLKAKDADGNIIP